MVKQANDDATNDAFGIEEKDIIRAALELQEAQLKRRINTERSAQIQNILRRELEHVQQIKGKF